MNDLRRYKPLNDLKLMFVGLTIAVAINSIGVLVLVVFLCIGKIPLYLSMPIVAMIISTCMLIEPLRYYKKEYYSLKKSFEDIN